VALTNDQHGYPVAFRDASGKAASVYLNAQGALPVANDGFMAANQTFAGFTGTQALVSGTATTLTLRTVTAGTTYVITDIVVSSDSVNTTVVPIIIYFAGVPVFYGRVSNTAPLELAGIESFQQAAAGSAVTMKIGPVTGTPNVDVYVGALEQQAYS
jgi:hypothetical protein